MECCRCCDTADRLVVQHCSRFGRGNSRLEDAGICGCLRLSSGYQFATSSVVNHLEVDGLSIMSSNVSLLERNVPLPLCSDRDIVTGFSALCFELRSCLYHSKVNVLVS